jgi:serine/threonine protein kinase
MGVNGSRSSVNEDYKLTYDEDYHIKNSVYYRPYFKEKDKSVKVLIDKGIVETIPITDADLTVGWLLSEVVRRYDNAYENDKETNKLNSKKVIVGLKSVHFHPTLDFYLTELDNLLSPIKDKTLFTVHFSKIISAPSNIKKRKIGPEDFKFLKVIGKGSYSFVTIARKKDSGRLYAIKIMKKRRLFREIGKQNFESESKINKIFRGTPFVSNTYYAFQTEDEMFLVMELCPGGTLFDYLRKLTRKHLNYDIVRFYIAEIIIALEFVHAQNVMYRDLKPENILIDVDGHIKLADFGLSKVLENRNAMSETFWGSPEYLPPEMVFGHKHTRLVDFYTLGCLVYEIIVGYPPFYSRNPSQLREKMLYETLKFPKDISQNAKDLIQWLVNQDPEQRPKEFSEVKNHIFFENLHWGKLAKKQVIPPYIPDLYKLNFDIGFWQLPIDLVFDPKTILKKNKKESVYLEPKNHASRTTALKDISKSVWFGRNNSNFDAKSPKSVFWDDLNSNWIGKPFLMIDLT